MRRAPAATVFGCASVLLSYPDEDYARDLASVRRSLGRLPQGVVRSRLDGVAAWLARMAPMEAAAVYVDTFDLDRSRSLYLSWYRHGDTRERGMALAALAGAYRAVGFSIGSGELPDFLPAMLELAAVGAAGAAVLAEHRSALDALSQGLHQAGSPYAAAVLAVGDALPAPSRADRAALRRYRSEGPPSERVGLEPFAPPEVVDGHAGQRAGQPVELRATRR
ncbi:MAG: nitrate reductase molybdenum cofactor assembly chaperone [Acidimicrobiales bacterium]